MIKLENSYTRIMNFFDGSHGISRYSTIGGGGGGGGSVVYTNNDFNTDAITKLEALVKDQGKRIEKLELFIKLQLELSPDNEKTMTELEEHFTNIGKGK